MKMLTCKMLQNSFKHPCSGNQFPSFLHGRSQEIVLFPGDGFSSRAEDAVLQGCLPVVIMDDVEPTFSNILDWSAFSIRIAEVRTP